MRNQRKNILTIRVSQNKDGEKNEKKFKKGNNTLFNTKKIITEAGRCKVPSGNISYATISNQSENVSLVESALQQPKHNEILNIMGKVDNIFISFVIKMTETLAIDNVLLKIKSTQGRVNESFITGNHTLRKKRRKYKPMTVAYEIDKLMVENNMKDEEKIEIVANNYSNSYVDDVSYDQSMSRKKSIDLAKIYK